MVEASPTNEIWGIGLNADDPRARNPALWRGTNWLGMALMQVRQTIRQTSQGRSTALDPALRVQLDARLQMAPK